MTEIPATMRQLRSLVTPDRELRLSVGTVDTPRPGQREVLVRVEAAPVNPSDLGLLLAMADVSQAVAGRIGGRADRDGADRGAGHALFGGEGRRGHDRGQ